MVGGRWGGGSVRDGCIAVVSGEKSVRNGG